MLKIGNVTFDCANPASLAAFWGEALGYDVESFNEDVAQATNPEGARPNLFFLKVPEGRTVKNRVHLDVEADDREVEIERLIGLGATRGETHTLDEWGMTWTVLRDPEGNELCVMEMGAH